MSQPYRQVGFLCKVTIEAGELAQTSFDRSWLFVT
jgi:hypothetical protein